MKSPLMLFGVLTRTMVILLVSAMTIIFTSPHSAAFDWTEVGDAGELPGEAQMITGDGPLELISGSLASSTDVDMYAIYIRGDGSFSATTVDGTTDVDTQLALFDSLKRGIYFNDDDATDGLQSTLPAFHTLTPMSSGLYYLAISDYDIDPANDEGYIFHLSWPHISNSTDVLGPIGDGGESPVSMWIGISTTGGGSYTISLTGTGITNSPPEPVAIDIKPGSDPNSINLKSKGKIPVAILSTLDFYAPAQVNTESLTFGPVGDEESLAFCNGSSEDVNDDGYEDIVCHFYRTETLFQCGDEQGILKGYTVDEIPIEGSDSVRTVPCHENMS